MIADPLDVELRTIVMCREPVCETWGAIKYTIRSVRARVNGGPIQDMYDWAAFDGQIESKFAYATVEKAHKAFRDAAVNGLQT